MNVCVCTIDYHPQQDDVYKNSKQIFHSLHNHNTCIVITPRNSFFTDNRMKLDTQESALIRGVKIFCNQLLCKQVMLMMWRLQKQLLGPVLSASKPNTTGVFTTHLSFFQPI
jgi:hypothetical protein